MTFKRHVIEGDPYPEREDHHLWDAVFRVAQEFYSSVWSLLLGMRASGARLKVGDRGLIMYPVFSDDVEESAWPDKEKWKKEKEKYLLPRKDEIKEVFNLAFRMLRAEGKI